MKSIEYLKQVLPEKMQLRSQNKDFGFVERFPNNVIKVNNILISWENFRNMLINENIRLEITENQTVIGNNQTVIGKKRRPGHPGVDPAKKKVIKSVSLSPKAIKLIEYYLEGFEPDEKKPSFSQVIENAILKLY